MNTNNKKILVVCRGNIVRSPFAEVVINHELKRQKLDSNFVAISRGTQGTLVDPVPVKFPNITFYKDEFRFSEPILKKFGVDITKHTSKPINRKTANEASVIFAVDERNKTALLELFPDLKDKIFKLSELINKNEDFADPEGLYKVEKHSKILSEIRGTILKGFPNLLALANKAEKN